MSSSQFFKAPPTACCCQLAHSIVLSLLDWMPMSRFMNDFAYEPFSCVAGIFFAVL